MKHIKGNWIMEKDEVIGEDLEVDGHILGKDGSIFDLKVKGNINAWNINARDINARDINARDINAGDINAWNINAWNIDAGDISFWAVCIAYNSFKCKSAKARRNNYVLKCLDGEIEYKEEAGKT